MTVPFRSALAVLTLALAACGESSPTPAGPSTTLSGQLSAAAGGVPQGELRLALAWYPGLLEQDGAGLSSPGAVQVQDAAYAGELPLDYAFAVTEAPPAAALRPMPTGFTGEAAVGVLLAYQDLNGNGTLDVIPADGTPIDRVVGASLEWTRAPGFVVAYLTDAQAPGTGLEAGFNLLRLADAETTEVVPLSTPVPLPVGEGGPWLDLFACAAVWDGSAGGEVPCGLVFDEGIEVP